MDQLELQDDLFGLEAGVAGELFRNLSSLLSFQLHKWLFMGFKEPSA